MSNGTTCADAEIKEACRRQQAMVQGLLGCGQCIESDPKRRGGVPVLARTRFPVSQLLAELSENQTIKAVCDDYSLDYETAVGAVTQLSHLLSAAVP